MTRTTLVFRDDIDRRLSQLTGWHSEASGHATADLLRAMDRFEPDVTAEAVADNLPDVDDIDGLELGDNDAIIAEAIQRVAGEQWSEQFGQMTGAEGVTFVPQFRK